MEPGKRGRGWRTFHPSNSGVVPRSEGSLSLHGQWVIDAVSSPPTTPAISPLQLDHECLFNVRECVVSAWSPALDGLQKDHGTIDKKMSRVLVAAFQMPALILQQQHVVARFETAYVWKHAWND